MNCKIIRPGRLTSASKPLETVRTIVYTDSVCSVNKLEQNQFANSTPGTHFSPSRLYVAGVRD